MESNGPNSPAFSLRHSGTLNSSVARLAAHTRPAKLSIPGYSIVPSFSRRSARGTVIRRSQSGALGGTCFWKNGASSTPSGLRTNVTGRSTR